MYRSQSGSQIIGYLAIRVDATRAEGVRRRTQ
jgi:hypothetical protein